MALYLPGCHIVGLDIGAHSIKAVQLTTSLTDFKITGFMVREHRISTWKDLSEALRSLAQEEGMQGDIFVTSFPSHRVLFRNTEMPFTQPGKIDATIRFEAESVMASPLDGMIVDFALLAKRPQGSSVLITCVQEELLHDYMGALHEGGVVPDTVDIDSLALIRLMEEIKKEGTIVLLDMGAEKISANIFHEGGLQFTRSIPLDAAGKVGLKKIKPTLDEVIFSIKAYQGAGVEAIDEIWLIGGRSRIKGAADYLNKEVGAPILYPDFAGSIPSSISLPEEANLLGGVALGLALRGLRREKGRVDLARKVPTPAQTIPPVMRKRVLRMAVAAVILVILIAANFFLGIWAKERKYTMLKGEMRRMFQETFPEVRGEGKELQLSRELVKGMGERGMNIRSSSGGTFLEIIREVAQLLPQGTKIVELDMDKERVSLRGMAPSFSVVDEVKGAFTASKLFHEVNVGNVEIARRGEQGVIFRMVLTREAP